MKYQKLGTPEPREREIQRGYRPSQRTSNCTFTAENLETT